MKKIFKAPRLVVIDIEVSDIITTSPLNGDIEFPMDPFDD